MSTDFRIYPTSFSQQFRCEVLKSPGHISKNEFDAIRLRGIVDAGVLHRAIAEVVNRHEALRTDFPFVDGQYVQRVWRYIELPIRYVDAQHHLESDWHATLRAEQRLEIRELFDVEHAPLARILLMQIQPDELIVAVTVEHLIIDGLSMGVFWRDLLAAYAALVNGTDLPPPPSRQFGDFAIWQRARLTEERIETLKQYWRQAFCMLPPPLQWRSGRPRPARFSYQSRAIGTMLDLQTTEALTHLAAAVRANLFAVLNAFYVLAIARVSDGRDILVNTAVANRRRAEFDDVIGFFAQKVILRFKVADGLSIGELVRNCHRTTLEAIVHSEIHLGLIKSTIGDPADESYAFRQQISHLHYSFTKPGSLQVPGLRQPPEPVALDGDEMPNNHDLVLYSGLATDGIVLKLWYYTGIFDAPAAQEVLDEICALCARAASSDVDEHTLIHLGSEVTCEQ